MNEKKNWTAIALLWMAALTVVPTATLAVGVGVADLDVYKYSQNGDFVPDVDKAAHGDVLNPTCWQAAAANVLAAAGYGIGPSAQARADAIYTQLTTDLGKLNPGGSELAINYWLYTYGKNPSSNQFMPSNAYTDVTVASRMLAPADYNFLLSELSRCQYVTVSWEVPNESIGHCVTLVGGNYWNNPNAKPGGNISVWHDSDRTQSDVINSVTDDAYPNAFPGDPAPPWNLPTYPLQNANKYVTLCPGLNKPEAAMLNYDLAQYKADLNQDGLWTVTQRVAGAKANIYNQPSWDNSFTLRLGNEVVPNMRKEVYLLVDYLDRIPGRSLAEIITLQDDLGRTWTPTNVTASADDGQLLFHWSLDYQPAFELLLFPSVDYMQLTGNIKDWDVSTICIPEPATVVMILAGVGLMIRRRRRRMG